MPTTVSVIANPAAGGGHARKILPHVCNELGRLGIPYRAQFTRDLAHAHELARAAAADGEIAAALGGDGLVAAVAEALCGSGGTLAVIPGGRGNDFARSLGITTDPIAACRVISEGAPRLIDVGVATPSSSGSNDPASASASAPNGAAPTGLGDGARVFIGIAICGLDAETNRVANETKVPLGHLVYISSALRVLARWHPVRFDLRLDSQPKTVTGYAVSIANSTTYGGGMRLAPNAILDDGCFDVVMVSDTPKLRLLGWLPKIFFAKHLGADFLEITRASEIEIVADRPTTMYADGEALMPLPATVKVHHAAITVMAPR